MGFCITLPLGPLPQVTSLLPPPEASSYHDGSTHTFCSALSWGGNLRSFWPFSSRLEQQESCRRIIRSGKFTCAEVVAPPLSVFQTGKSTRTLELPPFSGYFSIPTKRNGNLNGSHCRSNFYTRYFLPLAFHVILWFGGVFSKTNKTLPKPKTTTTTRVSREFSAHYTTLYFLTQFGFRGCFSRHTRI